MKLAKQITLGEIQGENQWLLVQLDMLLRHVFVAGGTGGGKTMWVMMLIRQLINHGIGCTFISPHSDGREKILHWCMLNNIDPKRIVDVSPDTACLPSLDPFAHMPKGLNRLQEENWLQSTAGRFIAAMLSNVPMADQEVMNQLNAWLKNVLYCCGKRVDGEYLGVQKALTLLNVDDPEFDAAMAKLWPVLPEEIRFDFQMYRETKNVNQRQTLVRSTINRLRRVLFPNPIVTQMYAKRPNALNDEDIITGNKIQIVCVPEGDDLPREAGNVIGRMRISSMIASVKRLANRIPEHLRPYHFLIIDEAENFIGEDLRTGFQELRKFHMPIIIIVQDISCLVKGDMDLIGKVASQCNVQMTGNQRDKDSLDYLADTFSAPFLDHTPLMALQALPVGHEIIQTQSVSFNSTRGVSVSQAEAMTQSRSVTRQRSQSMSIQQSVSLALSETQSEGTTQGRSIGGSAGRSEGNTWSRGTGTTEQLTESESRGQQRSRSQTVGETETESDGVSRSQSDSFSRSRSRQQTSSSSNGTTESQSRGTTDGESESRGRTGPVNGYGQNLSVNAGESSSRSSSDGSGRSSSTSSGTSEGESETEGGSLSRGETHTQSRGISRTAGETEGESETRGRTVGQGRSETQGVGGSATRSHQANWTASQGQSRTDARGVTRTTGGSTGTSTGESEGHTRAQSVGRTNTQGTSESSGVAISFNQVPLPLTEILPVHTGSLVVSVADQVSKFKTCIARLPDRMMLVSVRGMDRPFLLKVHFVADPYDQKKLLVCEEWRQIKLRQYVAKIRKAHPFYFLPSLEALPAPEPKKETRKRSLKESPMS